MRATKAKLAQLSLLAAATASPLTLRQTNTSQSAISWADCPEVYSANATLPVQCGNLTVPLDYSDPNSSTFELVVIKVPAPKGPSKGSIFVNFGGPGGPTLRSLAVTGKELQTLTGGQYDLVGADPRGTGITLTFSCFANNTARTADLLSKQVAPGNASDTMLGRLWAAGALTAGNCATFNQSAALGPYITTASTVRDMMRVVDATNEDKLWRYYGYSYGTLLGATAAAMFPEKVDKVLLDGVVNPTQWYYGFDWDSLSETDEVFSQFFQQCVLHPKECALASSGNATAALLETATYEMIETLKQQPLPIPALGLLYDYSAFKGQTRASMYDPGTWPLYSQYLNGLLTGNLTQFYNAAVALYEASPAILSDGVGDDSPYGIQCGDRSIRLTDFADYKEAVDEYWRVSRLQGDLTNYLLAICSQWQMEPVERYMGGFKNLKPRKPLLLVGNTYDPTTPLKSAKNVTDSFEGSVLLQQNSYGHCTYVQPSLCTSRHIKAYFTNGTLPAAGTVCQPEKHPFSAVQDLNQYLDQIEAF